MGVLPGVGFEPAIAIPTYYPLRHCATLVYCGQTAGWIMMVKISSHHVKGSAGELGPI